MSEAVLTPCCASSFPQPDCLQCVHAEIAKLREENQRMENQLSSIVDEVLHVTDYPESTPNAVGQPVSTEPTPLHLVEHLAKKFKRLQPTPCKLDCKGNGCPNCKEGK